MTALTFSETRTKRYSKPYRLNDQRRTSKRTGSKHVEASTLYRTLGRCSTSNITLQPLLSTITYNRIRYIMAAHMPVEKKLLSKQDIEEGLVALSDALRVEGPAMGLQLPVRAVVAGGAIAVLKFGARISTHDVDFALDANQIEVENSIQRLADNVKIPTGEGQRMLDKFWFNPAMSFYLNAGPYRGAYQEAIQQGEALFRSDSLVLYVAPWKFQLYRKIGRVIKALWQNGERRINDIEDAVDLIHRFNAQLGRHLTLDEVKGWYRDPSARLDHKVAREATRLISERYRAKYGGRFSL